MYGCPRGLCTDFGADLCTVTSRKCLNNSFQFCAAVTGDSTDGDTLAVDPDSCSGPCAQAEQCIRTVSILLVLCFASLVVEWALTLQICVFLSPHRLSVCCRVGSGCSPCLSTLRDAARHCSCLQIIVAIVLANLSHQLADSAPLALKRTVHLCYLCRTIVRPFLRFRMINVVVGALNLLVVGIGFKVASTRLRTAM